MAKTTTIQISTDVRDELKRIGSMGDDYNKVIKVLIEEHNARKIDAYAEKYIAENRDKCVNINDLPDFAEPGNSKKNS
jgi:predicted CopG family antitoxin